MIWSKTDAGRMEMQTRSLVKERAQRNLLLLIDGVKTEATLMASISGVTMADLHALANLGLVVPVPGAAAAVFAAPAAAPVVDLQNHADFIAALTQLISEELGPRGVTLSQAVDKATSLAELQDVAERVLRQILERRGPEASDKARSALYGE